MLEIRGISKTYLLGQTGVPALRDLSLRVGPGESVALVGASGSGKSTVLHIAGLIDEPTGGEVWFAGENLGLLSERRKTEFRRDVFGFIFQGFHLVPVLTVLENVLLPAWLQGRDPAEAEKDARELLERVGLSGEIDRPIGSLSGGQRQRVAVARALVNRPRLVLADEPTANLDEASGRAVVDLLFGLCAARGAGLLLVTHDAILAARASRRVRLQDGKVA